MRNGCVVELIIGGADFAHGETVVFKVLKLMTRNGDLVQGQRDDSKKRKCAPLEFQTVESWR